MWAKLSILLKARSFNRVPVQSLCAVQGGDVSRMQMIAYNVLLNPQTKQGTNSESSRHLNKPW